MVQHPDEELIDIDVFLRVEAGDTSIGTMTRIATETSAAILCEKLLEKEIASPDAVDIVASYLERFDAANLVVFEYLHRFLVELDSDSDDKQSDEGFAIRLMRRTVQMPYPFVHTMFQLAHDMIRAKVSTRCLIVYIALFDRENNTKLIQYAINGELAKWARARAILTKACATGARGRSVSSRGGRRCTPRRCWATLRLPEKRREGHRVRCATKR